MKILHNPTTLLHRTRELVGARLIDAYESPERLTSILHALSSSERTITEVSTDLSAAHAAAAKVHTAEYLAHVGTIFESWLAEGMVEADGCVLPECFPVIRLGGKKTRQPRDLAARVGYYAFDMSTGISRDTYASAIASADLARRGAELLAEQTEDCVFALCRPPGHHCQTDLMGGYCYLNNTAIAVRTLLDTLKNPQEQVSILDLDFHHGNGTQSIFYDQKNPCYVSIHGEDEYPYFTGSPEETGEGEGEGYNLNLPLPIEAGDFDNYRPRLLEGVEKIRSVDTRWLVVSLGFDTFNDDPVGKFQLRRENYEEMGRIVGDLGIPTLLVLEGGYVVEELGNNCVAFLSGLEKARAEILNVSPKLGEGSEDWEEVLEEETVEVEVR
jgi:acetoin utilization deacetylase AcuC-like enzyme